MADERQTPATDGYRPGIGTGAPWPQPSQPEWDWRRPADRWANDHAGTPQPGQGMSPPMPAWTQPAQAAWPQPGVATMAWGAQTPWPAGYVPWGQVNPPPIPPILEPPANFHPAAPHRSVLSPAGRTSPGMYLFGLLVGGPAVAALLFLEVGARAGLSLKHLAISGELIFGSVCLATVLGLGAAGLAQSRQRRADGWRDYTGPAPLLVAGMLLGLIEGLSLALELALGRDSNLDGTTQTMLLLGAYALSYVTVVHLMAVRTGALTWRDMVFPRHLAPTMDELRPGRDAGVEVDASGRPRRSWRALVAGGVVGDFLLALVLLIPITIVSGLTIRLLMAILGLDAYDLSSPVPTGPQMTDRFVAFVAIALIVPAGEEIFFRGFVTNAWGRSLSRHGALIRGALFFAGIHMINVATTDADVSARAAIFNMGARIPIALAITWLYLRRRSIVASGSMHALYNGALVLISYSSY
jgi:membrane protease YdiL (CAAX protease family)